MGRCLLAAKPSNTATRSISAGFSDSCHATRARKSSLIVPGGLRVTARVSGDALTVLRTVIADWPIT